ncbi:hypothetical protein [Streptomyces roseochromogenus]|uniref:Uncharacterized protein n=1 Tax=Streptomyces roseochromogenus subsp. oscitans DS 12.976 TaxID=1352936 RepID=V6KRC7_STRRC|nr:hypothetical protein M878_09235 [Streptomyces roseochromogenus subsp. oscitans DS 12.976]
MDQEAQKPLLFGLRQPAGKFGERVSARVSAAGAGPGPRAVIEALLTAALPVDEESRVFHHLHASYAVLSVTDEALAAQPFIKDPDAAEATVSGLPRQTTDAGLLRPGGTPPPRRPDCCPCPRGSAPASWSAGAVLMYHLDRIFRDRVLHTL